MIVRSPNNWRRLRQLVDIAADDLVAVRPGLWVTGRATDIANVLIAEPQRYHDRSAFVRVDEDRQLETDDRHRVIRATLAALHAHLPTDWTAEIQRFVACRDRLQLPGDGISLLAAAYRDVIAERRAPRLRAITDEFIQRSLIRRSVQGHRLLGNQHRIRAMRQPVGELLRQATGGDRLDLVEAVNAVPALSADQRGELYLRLVVAMLGATGVALEWALIASATGHGAPLDEAAAAAVVAETQRMTPTAWVIARQARVDHRLGDADIRTKDMVLMLSYAAHRAPSAWPRPATFDPSRWPGATDRTAGSYVPFAAGPTTCPGRSVALRTLTEATAAFSRLYRTRYRSRRDRPYVRTLFAAPTGTLDLHRRTVISPGTRW